MNWTRYTFFLFWIICLFSFSPSIDSGFVFDFLGWQKEYEQGSFRNILDCFGYNGNHQVLHLMFYSFYKIFNIQGFPWYLLFCTLHAANGYLLFRLISNLALMWSYRISPVFAFTGSLIFMLHPYVVEPVVWKVCVHYHISLMAVLFILMLFIYYIQKGEIKTLIVAGCIYVISLFSLEISFVTPLMISFAGLITWILAENKKAVFHKIALYASSLWLLLGGYLVFNKLTLGAWVGHYGNKVHFNFDLLIMTSTELKYIFKHLFFARFYSYKAKVLLFDNILSQREVAFFSLCLLMIAAIIYFIKIRSIPPKWHLVFFGFFTSLLFVLTVSNMYYLHMHIGMNDRYSLIPMAFIMLMIVALISNFPKWLSYSILGILLSVSLFYQQKTLNYWKLSTEVIQSLKKDFRWHDAPFVFALNSPDNYRGIVMTSIINEPSGIHELIDYQTPKPFNGAMYDIFQFNMQNQTDGVKVEQTGPMQLKVTFSQWGNWWHLNGIGASSYENEYYKAEVLDYPYQITFKQFPEGSKIIYQDGMLWKEYIMTE